MNILVCIKQVPDDSVEIHLNAEGTPDLANVTPVVNAFDTYALEMAARLKESSEGEVTDRKSTRLNSSHIEESRMPSSA